MKVLVLQNIKISTFSTMILIEMMTTLLLTGYSVNFTPQVGTVNQFWIPKT